MAVCVGTGRVGRGHVGLWDAKPGDDSRAPRVVTRLGRSQELGRTGKDTLGSPSCLPAHSSPGWGWRLSAGSSSGCSHLGCFLHARVAPLLSRMLPGFWGLVGAVGTKKGPLTPGQAGGEQGKAFWKGSPLRTPGGALGKKSSCSAYAVEPGQESSHATSHRADFSGC